ncbi:nucleoside 2-deoxyribosyltransferase [Pseudomonas amygdali pv. tabaci str. ATCC 11528]|uniref:PfkB family carbohydrate kinase n=1 Tax=Pseudomonas amygdali TaxID=47877 RepID=UPI0001BC93BA|nr:PfkB family carbohydrate kinase [Pseudomonas amygdali]KEZ64693.1 nucleoside 2-deoxyribosyltransferase [Pseudomonas amygdali pv. tabaci str. ATCC 11528]KKY52969.1 nucleoside 2-deoxyribosyltransferase [Pseudomonas amygdali pv. tabaci str. ATCC 11528]QED85971.1 nucleoside 2-deoxyribosyltransferase [Pseudomonas amygdali pv. tabaci str. ATCC 11528]
MITVAGGIYYEQCMRPMWQELFGSGGRAATAIARLGGVVQLHTYADESTEAILRQRAALEGFTVDVYPVEQSLHFRYIHGLSKPAIHPTPKSAPSLRVDAEKVVCFGYLEGDCVVSAQSVVYDPQSSKDPLPFHHNGSTADRLALILNKSEADALHGAAELSPAELAAALAQSQQADIVIIKMGPAGALLHHNAQTHFIPSFVTPGVWKIGSGDVFVASFAYFWLEEELAPLEAATRASRATAYYCQTMGFGSQAELANYTPTPAIFPHTSKPAPLVYLAGPFFSLAQLWLVEEARGQLLDMGLRVFSPIHDVGYGSAEEVVQKDIDAIHECDLMLAIGDGLDAGTIYEIGYARALKKPVVIYVENESEESQKMMEGTDCIISKDFVTSIYQTYWQTTDL